MSSSGQFRVARDIFYDWTADDRPWCSLALWLYIIGRGQYRDTTVTFLGHNFSLTRGQLVTSASHLCEVAGWTPQRLRTFLARCIKDGKITVTGTPNGTIITVIKYDKWQKGVEQQTIQQTIQQTKQQSSKQSSTDVVTHEQQGKQQAKQQSKQQQSIEGVQYLKCPVSKQDCADEEKDGAPYFENPDHPIFIPEEPEAKPDKALQVTTSAPYLLASWFYTFRGVPAKPTPADMHYFKLLLDFYPESTIQGGIKWRLSHDPDGYWQTHITSTAVHRQFGNWMAESSVKAISLRQWIEKNPDLDYRKFTTELAAADGFMRAFNEAKKNRLVYFEDSDYTMYQKAIRIKTRESKAETKEMIDGRNQ